jgi:hypothetical protein
MTIRLTKTCVSSALGELTSHTIQFDAGRAQNSIRPRRWRVVGAGGGSPSVAQLVSRYHAFSTGRDSLRRRGNPRAGRCSAAMRPVASTAATPASNPQAHAAAAAAAASTPTTAAAPPTARMSAAAADMGCTAAAATASTATASTASTCCKPYAGAKLSFLVENVKGPQAHIKHFLLGEKKTGAFSLLPPRNPQTCDRCHTTARRRAVRGRPRRTLHPPRPCVAGDVA